MRIMGKRKKQNKPKNGDEKDAGREGGDAGPSGPDPSRPPIGPEHEKGRGAGGQRLHPKPGAGGGRGGSSRRTRGWGALDGAPNPGFGALRPPGEVRRCPCPPPPSVTAFSFQLPHPSEKREINFKKEKVFHPAPPSPAIMVAWQKKKKPTKTKTTGESSIAPLRQRRRGKENQLNAKSWTEQPGAAGLLFLSFFKSLFLFLCRFLFTRLSLLLNFITYKEISYIEIN